MGHTQGSFHVVHLSPLTTSFLPIVGPRGVGVLPVSLSLQGLSAVPPGYQLGTPFGWQRDLPRTLELEERGQGPRASLGGRQTHGY